MIKEQSESGVMTLGSLFDGIGGFPLAASRHGIKPIWASEIQQDCVDIICQRFLASRQTIHIM